jgi:hypothetical protein
MTRYFAIPLADRGFMPTGERNRVRWYVERDDRAWPVLGPYASMEAADFAAGELNREGEQS